MDGTDEVSGATPLTSVRSVKSVVPVGRVLLGFVSAASALLLTGCPTAPADALVVYCAHDEAFARQILDDFERETGIRVAVKFDTEASKSLGLVNQIVREAKTPRCDVFWNNETLGTIDLARRGLLEPYKGPGYERIPDRYKDPEGRWCGFAARLRVWIVNTDRMTADPVALNGEIEEAFGDQVEEFTYAKPLFGTTLTHYCVLAAELGLDRLKELDARLREKAVMAASNGQTRDLVANGTCAFGWTDTDDYFGAVDSGKPVAMVPVAVKPGRPICIPNSVAIVKGTRRRKDAERLVDYLLSRETELKLARSESRQIPLGDDFREAELPQEVRAFVVLAGQGADLSAAADAREEVLHWLVETYTH